jgi:hypothetical protein
MTKQEEILIKQKTVTDVALVGYMMFINEKGLLDEAKKFVEGFISSLKKEEFEILIQKNKELLEQLGATNDATRSA